MAKNDFKAFATDRNANVISQEEWEALPALLSGFTAGKASSAQVNKVIRQASFIAAALAQFVSDKTQRDVLDNGDLPGFVELLGSGFAVEYLSRKNPFGDIKSDGTVETALENLGLGEGSALPVGVPVPWPTATPPAGWLQCNGATFTKEQYPVLARVYPTLRLPDLRGEFIRGWDDGRKVDTGRKLLSAQGATLLRTAMLDYYNQDTTGTSGIVGMGFNNEDSITDLREGSFKMPDGTTFSDPVIAMSDNGMQATILTSIRSGYAKGITVRPRSIALNYIVRAV
ncbi:phage tail protein [Escherichia coli]|uniref:phage tail protein n=1 Tax=Escherichia coli TaxID=562 RepID=UPI0005DF2BB3|nr:phage tail protein [Escherichia coli]CFX82564.1 Fels-2 prophage Pin [Salmonella enterica subsp. enterica serovar Typhi]CFY16013.1 Fels-2 prophage Pin [Salmonella enterica subsp. enterica serovar Typhi]CGJ70890.1 Fels-2 prophage Pin [Salmonella enterica subsp. enterica serovar Typhi]CGL09355.1 Fels-2 prophage Pin [Salmonella enterica subsp. enterica serovar Typhi]CIL79435.1 Fels-2 prophage Pin [Salmonella enterica subsp. enterica serovar Typhi]